MEQGCSESEGVDSILQARRHPTPLRASLCRTLRQPAPTAPRIAIIGGGISGLAAAHRLTELLPHAELALFEAADRLGGVLDTVQRDGFLIERSADNFLTKLPHAVDLCRRLGIADELLPTDEARRRALVVRDGRLLSRAAGLLPDVAPPALGRSWIARF